MISAVALRARIEARELAPEDAIRQSLEAIAASDGELRAFVATNAEGALASAAKGAGPLNGIAIGVKDIIDTADMTTEITAGDTGVLVRIKAGPSSGVLVVNAIEICMQAQ